MKIAILSRGPFLYSTQRIVRAVRQRGHQPRVIDHARCQYLMGQEGNAIFYQGQPLPAYDGIIPRIGSSVTGLGAALISQFEVMGVYTATSAAALLLARDKLRCL